MEKINSKGEIVDTNFTQDDPDVLKGTEVVGFGCYTSPKWNRGICNARRVEFGGYRLYAHGEGPSVIYHRGATHLSEKVSGITGEDKYLKSWRKSFTDQLGSSEKFDTWMQATADFGTQGHILYDLLIGGSATVQNVEKAINDFADQYNMKPQARFQAIETAKKNLLSFRQFVIEHNFETIAVEQMVKKDSWRTSTPIDIVGIGEFRLVPRGKKERCWFLGNLKTSENAQNHSWQCAIEYWAAVETILPQMMAMEELPVMIGTVRPKDWRTEPSFELKDYTEFAKDPKTLAILDRASEILELSGVFKEPKIFSLTWEGALSTETNFTTKNVFSVLSEGTDEKTEH